MPNNAIYIDFYPRCFSKTFPTLEKSNKVHFLNKTCSLFGTNALKTNHDIPFKRLDTHSHLNGMRKVEQSALPTDALCQWLLVMGKIMPLEEGEGDLSQIATKMNYFY